MLVISEVQHLQGQALFGLCGRGLLVIGYWYVRTFNRNSENRTRSDMRGFWPAPDHQRSKWSVALGFFWR